MAGINTRLAAVALLAVFAGPALAAPAPAAPPPGAWTEPQAATAGGKFVMQDGQTIFHNVCANCHMQDAKGAAGAGVYPSLASNPTLGAAAYPIMVVAKGQKGMPAFGELLDDNQIAAVVGYVRTHFGNRFRGAVTAAEVKAMR